MSARDVYDARGFGGRQGAGAHPVVVVVDFIEGFTNPASALACDADAAVAATRRLLDAARAAGVPVIFTTVSYGDDDLERAAMFVAKAPALATLRPGSAWVEVDSRLAPGTGEPVLVKLFASAFFGTHLDEMLREAGCDTVIVTGASTSGCVRATAVDALQYGYRVLVPREGVADRAVDAHNGSLLDIDAKYGDVISIDEAIATVASAVPLPGCEPAVSGADGTIVAFNAARVAFGTGATAETGEHLRQLGVTRALVVCDRFVTESGLGERIEGSLRAAGVESVVYDHIVGEPNETSVQEAVEAARGGGFAGFVGVGGGSALDTAKLCALFATHEGDLLDYVNAPIGAGRAVPGPVLPIVALPTTSGTGSEVTTVAIVDFPRLGTKTGVSHQYLRPSLAIVDPVLTVSCPPGVTASTGIDALMHALEAYTVSPYDTRPRLPLGERPPYQGANPFSDPLCERAIELVGGNLRTAVLDGSDIEARTAMALASTIAGIAFSGAGVHIPHALAYPIASLQHEWTPPGYGGAALVPHGFAVAVTAPAVFRFIADAAPERCATAARLLDGGDDLAVAVERLMEDLGAPTRLSEIGYSADDLGALVPGALDQRRLLVGAPKEVGAAELEELLRASL